jgi:signal peptidase I
MKLLRTLLNFTMDSLETITFIGSIYMVLYLFVAAPRAVNGASMDDTLHNGDRLIIEKVSYQFHLPERGDIVDVQSPKNHEIEYVKRIIAVEGDSLEFRNGDVYLNGNLLKESYISEKTYTWDNGFSKENTPIIVPKGYIFVMGDNRSHSSDSREWGLLPITSIVGKAVYRYYPPHKVTFLTLN